VPADHLLRSIDGFADRSGIREHLKPFYSEMGRPSIDPELMIRMLIIGYCMGIRSERRLCDEVHLNLAYRWFCRLGLEGDVPDHSTFRGTGMAVPATATCCYAYSTNYLIDLDHAVIMDVEPSTAVRQAEVTACKRMIARTQDCFGVWPERLAADTGYGSAEMLAWLVHERDIHPHIPVFDKSVRHDGTFERADFSYDIERDLYRYRARKAACDACALQPRAAPTACSAKSCAQSMKALATWPVISPPPTPAWPRDANGRRSRCCLRTSNAS